MGVKTPIDDDGDDGRRLISRRESSPPVTPSVALPISVDKPVWLRNAVHLVRSVVSGLLSNADPGHTLFPLGLLIFGMI